MTDIDCGWAEDLPRRHRHGRSDDYEEVVGVPTREFRSQLVLITRGSTAPQFLIHAQPVGAFQKPSRLESRGVVGARVDSDEFPVAWVGRRLSIPRLVHTVASTAGGGDCGPCV